MKLSTRTIIVVILYMITSSSYAETIDLTSKMTRAKHQGWRNTCSAFAAVSLMEFLIMEETGEQIDLSENYTYWATKKYTLTTDHMKKSYQNIDGNAGFMAVESFKHGSMLESEWRYDFYNYAQMKDPRCDLNNPTTICYTGIMPQEAKLLSYRIEPIYVDLEDIPNFILNEKKPVVINVFWYFKAYDHNGDFHMPTQDELQAGGGGHVIILVGYDSETDRYIIKNSHGEEFGNKGFGTMPREYVETYLELKNYLPYISQYPKEVQDFLIAGSKGVSGNLIIEE